MEEILELNILAKKYNEGFENVNLLSLTRRARKNLLNLEMDNIELTNHVKNCIFDDGLLQTRNYKNFINLLSKFEDNKLQKDISYILINNKENYSSEIELIRLLEHLIDLEDEQIKVILAETFKSPVFAKSKRKSDLIFLITMAPSKAASTLISTMACDDKYRNYNQLYKDIEEIWDCVDPIDAVATFGKQQEKLFQANEKNDKKVLYKTIYR